MGSFHPFAVMLTTWARLSLSYCIAKTLPPKGGLVQGGIRGQPPHPPVPCTHSRSQNNPTAGSSLLYSTFPWEGKAEHPDFGHSVSHFHSFKKKVQRERGSREKQAARSLQLLPMPWARPPGNPLGLIP